MEAVRDFEIYEHGCCGGQRAAMWRHLYGLDNDAAHDYRLRAQILRGARVLVLGGQQKTESGARLRDDEAHTDHRRCSR